MGKIEKDGLAIADGWKDHLRMLITFKYALKSGKIRPFHLTEMAMGAMILTGQLT